MKLILLRHGETIWNQERRLQGCMDIPLAETGIEQIRRVGRQLAGSESGRQIDLILCSPLLRARRSAEIIAKALHIPAENVLDEPLFIERGFGVCEGFTYEEALTQYPDGNYPGMETLDELYIRAGQALECCAKKYPDHTILAASHGAMIKALLVVASNGKIGYFDKDIWIENGSCCMLEKQTDNWEITFPLPFA